jgi:hypothetical protein
MLHSSISALADVIPVKLPMLASREDVQITAKASPMSQPQKTPAQIAALAALEQAYAYYTPAPFVVAAKEDVIPEYYEYAKVA